MGLLGKFFGPAKPQEVELTIEAVPDFVEKKLSGKRPELETAIASVFSEIKHLLKEANTLLKELENQPLESENIKLKKIVSTSRSQAISRIGSLIERLQPPTSSDFAQVKQYCDDAGNLLHSEITHSGKSIAYTGIYLKDAMKNLGKSLSELGKAFSSLEKKIEEFSPLFLEQELKQQLSLVDEKKAAVSSLEKEIEKAEQLLEKERVDSKRLFAELGKFKDSPEFKKLGSLNEEKALLLREKQEAKTELVSLISSIDRPLKRLSRSVASGRYVLPQALTLVLHKLEQNPLQLFKLDPKGELVKTLLLELKKAIESGAVELKDREREKRLAAIDELLAFNFFSNVFGKFNEIDLKLQAVETTLRGNPVPSELSSLERNREVGKSLVEKTENSIASLRSSVERETVEIDKAVQAVELLLNKMDIGKISLKK